MQAVIPAMVAQVKWQGIPSFKKPEPRTYYLRLRPKVAEVPGLYLAGQDVTCGGFVPAMMGGLLCAGNVLNVDDPFTLLRKQ